MPGAGDVDNLVNNAGAIPAGYRDGTVEEMAWIAASWRAPASWLSGTIIMADGGQHSRAA